VIRAALALVFASVSVAADAPRHDLYGDPLPAGAVARLGTLERSSENMRNFCFAADGKTFHATARGPAWVQFDAATGKRLRVVNFTGLDRSWPWVSADGSTAAVEQVGGHFHVIDVATGKVLLTIPASAHFRHFGDPFSPDGRYFAAAERTPGTPGIGMQALTVWEVRSGQSWALPPQADHVRAVRFLSGASRVIVFGGRTAAYWDLPNQTQWWTISWPEHHLSPLISPNEKLILLPAGHERPTMQLLDAARGQPAAGLKPPPHGTAWRFTDDRHVLVGSFSGSGTETRLWDTREGVFKPTDEKVLHGSLSPDRTRALYVSWQGRVQMYDSKSEMFGPKRDADLFAFKPRRGHEHSVIDAAFDPVTGRVVTLDRYSFLWAWDRDGVGKLVGAYQDGITVGGALVPRRDGKRWLIQNRPDDRTGTIRLVAPLTGLRDVWTRYPEDPVQGFVRPARAHLSADGSSIRTAYHLQRYGNNAGTPSSHIVFETLDVKTGKPTRTREVPIRPLVRKTEVAISPDGRLVTDARVVCDFDTGQVVTRLARAGEVPLGVPVFSADGRFLAARMTAVKKWTPQDFDRFAAFAKPWEEPVEPVEEEPSTPVAGQLPHVWVWDVFTGHVVGRVTVGADHLRLTPDGRFLVTLDTTGVSAWDVASGRQLVHHTPDHRKLEFEGGDQTSALAVSPDGRLAVTARFDSTALVWDMSGASAAAVNVTPLSAGELAASWAAFATPTGDALGRWWRLVDHPAASVPFLRDRVRATVVPYTPPTPAAIRATIGELDDDDFAARESAEKKLSDLGELARREMLDGLKATKSGEQRTRLTRLLTTLDTAPVPPLRKEDAALAWALAALERIGTPEARDSIRVLASGPPNSRLTREASAALERLPK
jgi:WD40 repeat protein